MHTDDILEHPDCEALRARFTQRVDRREDDECWPWTGTADPNGYGVITFAGKLQRAHRLAYLFTKGPIGSFSSSRSMSVCHACDNPTCCNPAHLFVGTDRDNVHDMVAKGRIQQGEQHHAAKLTADQVAAIRADRRRDRLVAADYGVSNATVAGLRKNGSWPSLGPIEEVADRHAESVLRGSDVSAAKLTEEQVLAIRADPRTLSDIAADYGVGDGSIASIKYRKTWCHLPPRPEDVPAAPWKPAGPLGRKTFRESGKLAQLRRVAEVIIASREEMDEGWFVPTEVMTELDKLVLKR